MAATTGGSYRSIHGPTGWFADVPRTNSLKPIVTAVAFSVK